MSICKGVLSLASLVLGYAPSAVATPMFGGNSYFLSQTATTWAAAEAEAVANGGHLASIHDQAQMQFIITNFLSGSNSGQVLWMGLYDPTTNDGSGSQHQSDFVWSDGSQVDFVNWNSGEPNNTSNAEYWGAMNWHSACTVCVGLGYNITPGSWNDTPMGGTVELTGAQGPYFGLIEVAGPVSVPEPVGMGIAGLGWVFLASIRRRSS